jgi:CRP-like cAMP-binding protein
MKTNGPKITMLRSVPELAELPRRDLSRLACLFDEARVDAGQVLAREGQSCHELSLIVEGQAALSRRGQPLGVVGPGEFLGEMAILDRGPHAATVTAQTPMRVLVSGRDSWGTLRTHPDVLRHIATNLAGRLRWLQSPQPVA